jgi:hypothetical protein
VKGWETNFEAMWRIFKSACSGLVNFISDPSAVCKLMDHLMMVFIYVFLKFFNIFVDLLELGCPERSSSPTDTKQALKRECHLKTAVWLKECSPKAS